MKFDCDDPDCRLYPAAVYDAWGHEIMWVKSGDTETGECVISVRDSQGVPYECPEGEFLTARVTFMAPLRLVTLAEHNDPNRFPEVVR